MIEFSINETKLSSTVSLSAWTPIFRAKLVIRLNELTAELLAAVRAAEPSRTGRLRSATHRYVDDRKTFVRGRVIILGRTRGERHNVAAAALEYGAHKNFAVQAYSRRGVRVSGYRRTAKIAERRFLRGPVSAIRARAVAAIQQVINETNAEMAAKLKSSP